MILKDNKEYEYKGYKTKFQYSKEDKVFWGKILNINDLICFDGNTLSEAYDSFIDTVEEYILYYKDIK